MSAFDFSRTWETVENGDDTTGDGYPILQSVDRQAQLEAQNVNAYAGGEGSESTPYEISNWYHLDNVSRNLGSEFVLTTDLDSSTAGYDDVGNSTADGGEGFNPIGEFGNEFTGTFTGTNHTISGLYIDRDSSDHIGLFGVVDGRVENVGVENVTITGKNNVGGLVGYNGDGTITNSYATGSVTGTERVGGLAGDNDGTINTSSANASVTGTVSNVGGLVGQNFNTINKSYATGAVNGTDSTGGLVGYNGDSVSESYATGAVNGTGDSVGGLVGVNYDPVSKSYATGNVSGDTNVGGLIGETFDPVSESYATGNVSGDTDVGGLIGNSFGTVTDGYWDTESTNQSSSADSPVANGLTTAEMQRFAPRATMDGFSFGDSETWNLTSGYPALAWESVDEPTVDSVEVSNTTATAGTQTRINVTAIESGTDAGAGVNVSVIANDSLGELPVGTTAVTDANGNATFTFNETVPADYALEFELDADPPVSDTATVTVDPANATAVRIDTEPTDTTAGEVIGGPPRATVTDQFGNPVDGVEVTVTEEGGYSFDSGTTNNETVGGLATFDDLVITTADSGYQLNVSINASDRNVSTADSQLSNTFTISTDSDDNDDSGGGSSGGSSSGSDDETDTTQSTVVTGEPSDDGSVGFTVSDPEGSGEIVLSLTDEGEGSEPTDAEDATDSAVEGADPESNTGQQDDASEETAEPNVEVERLSVQPTETGSREFDISVRQWEATSESTGSDDDTSTSSDSSSSAESAPTTGDDAVDLPDPQKFTAETGSSAIGYVEITHSNPDEEIEGVEFRFRVRSAYLDEQGVEPEEIALYRDETDRWNRLAATEVETTDTHHVFEAESPGLSVFAIAAPGVTDPTDTASQPAVETEEPETESEIPGFGLSAAATALLATFALMWRRSVE